MGGGLVKPAMNRVWRAAPCRPGARFRTALGASNKWCSSSPEFMALNSAAIYEQLEVVNARAWPVNSPGCAGRICVLSMVPFHAEVVGALLQLAGDQLVCRAGGAAFSMRLAIFCLRTRLAWHSSDGAGLVEVQANTVTLEAALLARCISSGIRVPAGASITSNSKSPGQGWCGRRCSGEDGATWGATCWQQEPSGVIPLGLIPTVETCAVPTGEWRAGAAAGSVVVAGLARRCSIRSA